MRLAARRKEAEDSDQPIEADSDPDSEDSAALETASEFPVEPISNLPELKLDEADVANAPSSEPSGLQVSGIRLCGTTDMADRAEGVYSSFDDGLDTSSSSSSSSSTDSDDDGTDRTAREHKQLHEGEVEGKGIRRRPSTTEARYRIPLDEDDEDVDLSFSLSPASITNNNQGSATSSSSRSGPVSHAGVIAQQQQRRLAEQQQQQDESPFADPIDQFGDSSSAGEEDYGGNGSTDSSDEGDIVEIKPRRKS